MSSIYDINDLQWSWNGDFLMGDDGDLRDCRRDPLQSLRDEISSVCSSEVGDWAVYPGWGASISDFVGEPNTRTTADIMYDRIRIALVSSGIVLEEDLALRIVPISIHKVMILITVDVTPTAANKLSVGARLQVSLVFDSVQRTVFYLKNSRV